MPQCTCIESCYDSQRGELFDKGKTYEIAPTHQLICFFDCDAGKKARDAKREKITKLQAKSAKAVKARSALPDESEVDPESQQLDLSK